jgi:poly(3-hydroxybutyrate) depolymerase
VLVAQGDKRMEDGVSVTSAITKDGYLLLLRIPANTLSPGLLTVGNSLGLDFAVVYPDETDAYTHAVSYRWSGSSWSFNSTREYGTLTLADKLDPHDSFTTSSDITLASTPPVEETAVGKYTVVQPPSGENELQRRRFQEKLLAVPVAQMLEARQYHEMATGAEMPYRLYIPKHRDLTKKYPLVLYLHHAGETGNDNLHQIDQEVAIGLFTSPEDQAKHPCFVVSPQVPEGRSWADMNWGDTFSQQHQNPNSYMRMAFEIVDSLCTEFPIDTQRIYVTGTSMGGFGTWEAVARRPHFFAAAVPSSGGYDEHMASSFLDTPIWTLHGNADETINVNRTRHMVDAIRQAGGNIRYWEYQGVAHEAGRDLTYTNLEVYEWIFAQRRLNGEKTMTNP